MGIDFPAGGAGTTYWEGLPIFKNRVRESCIYAAGSSCSGSLPTRNSSGWPTANFDIMLWAGNGHQPSWISGTWDCGFVGSGSETVSALNGDTISNVTHRTGGAYSTFNLTNVGTNSGFAVTGVTQAVTNIFCYLPEYPGSTIDNPTSASAFTTEAIDHYKNYGWIRWMDWLRPIPNATEMTSSNRPTPANTQIAYQGNLEGVEAVPMEWCAAFSVAAGTGMWLTLPNVYDANFTYVTSLANALHAMVPAGTPIYIEISDELWNDAGPGVTAWETAATNYSGVKYDWWQYYSYQAHNIAAIFRSVFGSRYGTDVRLVRAWQSGSNGTYFQSQVNAYYKAQGWTLNAEQGGDFWGVSLAPYMNTGYTSGEYDSTVAEIEATLTTVGSSQAWASSAEEIGVTGLKYGLYNVSYEGGWQANSESSGLANGGAAIMDSGMTGVMNNYYQAMANSGFLGFSTYTGGVDANSDTSLTPTDELTYDYPITAANSPRFGSILNYTSGWTPTRNVVTRAGSTVSGIDCLDNSTSISSAYPTLGANGDAAGCSDAPNYGTAGEVTYLVWTATARSTTLVVNFTNSGGSAGSTELEYGSAPAGYSILGGSSSPTSISIPAGGGNVTIGTFNLAAGWNYVVLGKPGTEQADITVNSLTFN